MENYGKYITYDCESSPIKMIVEISVLDEIEKIFKQNYGLKFHNEINFQKTQATFVFDKSVDKETFLRHLETSNEEDYDKL